MMWIVKYNQADMPFTHCRSGQYFKVKIRRGCKEEKNSFNYISVF